MIQCNTDSCCEYMAGGVNIYLYGCVSLLVLECAVYVCVYVCIISNQSTSKKPCYVSDLNKFNALLYKTHSKLVLVLRYQGSIFIDP